MERMNLQLFGEAVSGKKIVYLFRVLAKAATTDGAVLAYTTENSKSKSKDADSTKTKDGSIRTPGVAEIEISATCYMAADDTLADELEEAMDQDKVIEIWEANLARPVGGSSTNKFEGKYYQGYLTSIELTSSAEDFAEYSLTFGVNGNGVKAPTGITVTADQQTEASYVFADTPKSGNAI